MTTNHKGVRTWIEIDTAALKRNYDQFRKLLGKHCLLMAVVKSNAYGHGLIDFSKAVEKLKIDWLGVDSITEALGLRKNGVRSKILVLGYTLPECFADARKNNISVTVSSVRALQDLIKNNSGKINIHLKIDTGMRRQGIFFEETDKFLKILEKYPSINLEGVYTHFAAAKTKIASLNDATISQFDLFKKALGLIKKRGFNPIKHLSATAGALAFPESRLDMARVGIGLYGLWPSKEIKENFQENISLKPILSWKTIIGEIKIIPKGSGVGYDFSERVDKDSKIAILPIGYWHGYPRVLSSRARALVKGKPAKVLGRISMDMTTIDISDIKNVKVGDEAVLLGRIGKSDVSADELANLAGTINYEIVTRINPLIKKFYI